MSWTDERVDLLKKLWADGLSASQIAGELGNVTRNAVIGKVHRLGLSGRAKPTRTAASRPRRPRAPSAPQHGAANFVSHGNTALKAETAPVAMPKPRPQPVAELVIPKAERKSILQLTEFTCKWPVGDPTQEDFYFCGRRSETGMPYCDHHARVAYQPAQDRRREKRAARG
ncbi:MAG TPA: GcrA family cell cycle regulator [Hyphomicrobiales bacterium]|nr:GcrA family cell cycle regulator [Rhodobiaceae bacterium]HXK53524.1 GcrA family cell cycle regulator [Hyphomicrobiales bacterium]